MKNNALKFEFIENNKKIKITTSEGDVIEIKIEQVRAMMLNKFEEIQAGDLAVIGEATIYGIFQEVISSIVTDFYYHKAFFNESASNTSQAFNDIFKDIFNAVKETFKDDLSGKMCKAMEYHDDLLLNACCANLNDDSEVERLRDEFLENVSQLGDSQDTLSPNEDEVIFILKNGRKVVLEKDSHFQDLEKTREYLKAWVEVTIGMHEFSQSIKLLVSENHITIEEAITITNVKFAEWNAVLSNIDSTVSFESLNTEEEFRAWCNDMEESIKKLEHVTNDNSLKSMKIGRYKP